MTFSAILIDYENIYYHLKEHYSDPPELGTYSSEIIRNLRKYYEDKYSLSVIVVNAYADFERIPSGSMSNLYLMGIMTKNVLGTAHKNAADMQMCIDLMEMHFTRKDINDYLIVAGDRDYIPVVKYLKRQGRNIYVSAFRNSISGDLLEIIGDGNFIDMEPHLSEKSRQNLLAHKEQAFLTPVTLGVADPIKLTPKGKIVLPEQQPKSVKKAKKTVAKPVVIPTAKNEDITEQVMAVILNYIDDTGYKEPGLGPLLRHLNDETPLLANWERKEQIEKLSQMGAVSVETKDIGYEYPISVLKVNTEHPLVQKFL